MTEIFRKTALDRLATPEQLDRAVVVTGPKLWIAVVALTTIVSAVIVWALVGEIRTRVTANGILMTSGGQVFGAMASAGGHLTEIPFSVGDVVEKGQVLATIVQPEMAERLRSAEESLRERRRIHEELSVALEAEGNLARQNYQRSKTRLQSLLKLVQEKVATAQQRWEDHERLFKEHVVAAVAVDRAKQAYIQAQSELADARTRLEDLESRELTRRDEDAARLNESGARVDEASHRVAEIGAALGDAKVVAPASGHITEIMVEQQGAVVQPGTLIMSIESGGAGLEVLAYIPPDIGKRVKPGMSALIYPATIKREEVGAMLGDVAGVSEFPVTSEGIVSVLQNRELAQTFTQTGPPYSAQIVLQADTVTASGYSWTSPKADDVVLTSGTMVSVEVTEKVQAPIELVVPLIREALGL